MFNGATFKFALPNAKFALPNASYQRNSLK